MNVGFNAGVYDTDVGGRFVFTSSVETWRLLMWRLVVYEFEYLRVWVGCLGMFSF